MFEIPVVKIKRVDVASSFFCLLFDFPNHRVKYIHTAYRLYVNTWFIRGELLESDDTCRVHGFRPRSILDDLVVMGSHRDSSTYRCAWLYMIDPVISLPG